MELLLRSACIAQQILSGMRPACAASASGNMGLPELLQEGAAQQILSGLRNAGTGGLTAGSCADEQLNQNAPKRSL